MSRAAGALTLAVALLVGPLAWSVADTLPPRSVARPPEEIRDAFLAYVVGVVMGDHEVDADGRSLGELFPEFGDASGESDFPFNDIDRLTRTSGTRGGAIEIVFSKPLSIPVPVDILGYRPGTIYTSRRIVFDEWPYDTDAVGVVHVMRRRTGELGIMLDRWLSALLGPLLSDVDAHVVAFAELDDRWFGILGGETPEGGSIVGVYDLHRGRIVIRPPRPLRELGRHLLEP
jgi:hypothetical protein